MQLLSNQALGSILDRFPASELHNTFVFVTEVILQRKQARELAEAKSYLVDLKSYDSISIEKLIMAGLDMNGVREATEVLFTVHESICGKPDTSKGIGSVVLQPPKLTTGGVVVGLSELPLQALDDDLSRRESVTPSGVRIPICCSELGGLWRCDNPGLKYGIRKKRREYFLFILGKGPAHFSVMRERFDIASQSLFSKEINNINTVAMKKLGIKPFKLIEHSDTSGYYANNNDLSWTRR